MIIGLLLSLTATAGDTLTCPFPHDPQTLVWVTPDDASPPPIDRRPAAHLRTATFALG